MMTLNWRRLSQQAGSRTPPRMWNDPLYDPQAGICNKPLRSEMTRARAALDDRVRDRWCNGVSEELIVTCTQQSGDDHACHAPVGADAERVTHRAYVQKKGDAVRTAATVVCGNVWYGVIHQFCENNIGDLNYCIVLYVFSRERALVPVQGCHNTSKRHPHKSPSWHWGLISH